MAALGVDLQTGLPKCAKSGKSVAVSLTIHSGLLPCQSILCSCTWLDPRVYGFALAVCTSKAALILLHSQKTCPVRHHSV